MRVAEQVTYEGVTGLRLGRFKSRIDTTCLVYHVGATLVDTGPANQWATLNDFLSQANVAQAVLTHHHEDHAGNAACIQAGGTPVYCPPGSQRLLSEGFHLKFYQQIVWGGAPRVDCQPLSGPLDAGSQFLLQPIPTPGHSSDMTSFLEPDKGWLFSGDLLITRSPRYLRIDEDVGQEMASLQQVQELNFDVVFCGHKGIVVGGKGQIAEKLSYLQELCGQAKQLRERGMKIRQITRRLLGREGLVTWLTGGHFSKQNLIQACLAATESAPLDDRKMTGPYRPENRLTQ